MKIEKYITRWTEKGLISQAQANSIIEFEKNSPQSNWVLYGVAGVGITAIMAGVISIFAAGWEFIPPNVKLISYFIIQAGLGVIFLGQHQKPGLVREVVLALFGLFFLAGIGLVGQIYNLEGDGWGAILFWCILALPPALLAQSRLLPEVWHVGLGSAVLIWTFDRVGSKLEGLDAVLVAIAVAYLVHAVGFLRLTNFSLSEYFTRAAQRWSCLALIAAIIFANFLWYGVLSEEEIGYTRGIYALLIGLAAVLTVFWISNPPYDKKVRYAITAAFCTMTLYIALPIFTGMGDQHFAGSLGFALVWACIGAAAAFGDRRRLFDFATLVVALRAITVYFEVFGTLAATGLGLILSGGIILGVVLFWHKYRRKLATLLGAAL